MFEITELPDEEYIPLTDDFLSQSDMVNLILKTMIDQAVANFLKNIKWHAPAGLTGVLQNVQNSTDV